MTTPTTVTTTPTTGDFFSQYSTTHRRSTRPTGEIVSTKSSVYSNSKGEKVETKLRSIGDRQVKEVHRTLPDKSTKDEVNVDQEVLNKFNEDWNRIAGDVETWKPLTDVVTATPADLTLRPFEEPLFDNFFRRHMGIMEPSFRSMTALAPFGSLEDRFFGTSMDDALNDALRMENQMLRQQIADLSLGSPSLLGF